MTTPTQVPGNTQLPITEQLINELTYEHDTFKAQAPKSDKQFDTSNEIEYYVISNKFVNEWKAMVEEVVYDTAAHGGAPRTVRTPAPMNMDLVENCLPDFEEYELKRNIQEGLDYKLYNYSTVAIFARYAGAKIPRRAYYNGHEKKVELYPIKFNFVYMSKSWSDLLRSNENQEMPVLTSLGYKNQTILDLIYRLVEYSKKDPRNREHYYINNAAAKIYFSADFDPKEHAKKLRMQGFVANRYDPPGSEINTSKIIGDLEIPAQKFMLIVQLMQQQWVYKSLAGTDEKQACEFCRQRKELKFECLCKQVKYCCEECKQKDWKYHVRSCSTQLEEDKIEPTFQIKANSKQGLVGLSNLGNTCYMNAALQCMIHTRDLTDYFITKKYLAEINETNPIGSKGKLIKSYAKFIESVITTEQDVVIPSRLKYAIGKTKEMFQGYQQHDSQQFLLFMLDTLHEDLNRVVNKPYTTGVENQGRPDHVVAKESWITYLKRNQSFINDLMGGQYRSQVKCPDCNNISVTFDPYLIFAVPIPTNEKAKSINLYYFYSNYNTDTLKITLSSKNNAVRELREDLATKTKTNQEEILFFVSGFNGSVRKVDDGETVDKLINEKQLNENSEEKQLFAMQFQKEELANLNSKKFLVFKLVVKNSRTLTFKRPFPMPTKNLKGSDLYNRICQFTLDLWTKNKAEGKQRETKLGVLKTKIQQQKLFKIYMSYGKPTEIKNKLTYQHRTEITPDTNVTELLQKCNYEAEFQVEYAQDPYYSFNSYKSYSGDEKAAGHYDYGEGPKTGSDESYTLEECFNEMKKSETLVEGNQVFCTKCEDLKLAEKKMQLYKASKYLVLQLRRFKQVGYQKCKNYAQIKFPFLLDLSSHIISPGCPQNYFMQDDSSFLKPKYWSGYDKSMQTKYRLYGVVNHHGGLNAGHYTAFGTHQGKWYKFDDKDVSQVDPEKVVSSAAYLLFYERL